ncbi:MAG: hypothetical protein K0Q50_928 [Vampirovibrio sp.]|jgi:hypothetical protein|nr:hypothetical protein [Vampirovibrio sp.]
MSIPAPSGPTTIYPAQSIMQIISHAWNLLRANLKSSLLIILGPTLLFAVFNLLVGLLSEHDFLTPTSAPVLTQRLLTGLLLLLMGIPCFFFWIFSCCALSRFYYSAIVQEQPISMKACWQYVLRRWVSISLAVIALSLSMLVLAIVDFVVLFIGLSLAFLILGNLTFSALGAISLGPQIMMLFFLLVFGFIILSVSIGLISFQGFFFTLPLIAISTAQNSDISVWTIFRQAYRFLFRNLVRLTAFGLTLFFFSSVITTVLMSPLWIWAVMEMTRLGVSQQHSIPLHVQSIMNIYSSLTGLLILPFHISALTLLWYDCQVRQEGLDLKIWFRRLLCNKRKDVPDFPPEMEYQPSV